MGLQTNLIREPSVPAAYVRSDHAWSNGFGPREGHRPFTLDQSESCLAARFRSAADRHARSTAVVGADGTELSYGDLLERSLRIAGGLQSSLAAGSGPVAILLPPGLDGVEAILGAVLAGLTWLPLDPSLPKAQLARILAPAKPAALLTTPHVLQPLQEHGELRGIRSLDLAELCRRPYPAALVETRPGQVAALFATSGTSGEPKLVGLSHRAILFDIGRQTNDLYLGPDDRFDLVFSLGFSASLAPLFGALLNGGQLHPLNIAAGSVRLLDWLEEREITISTMATSTFRMALATAPEASGARGRCPSLRLFSLGGESVGSQDVAAFRATITDSCVLQNAMASTETRTCAQYFLPGGSKAPDPLPIGWPVWGKEVLLLDEEGNVIGGTGEGEVAIASRYLAEGYINDAVRTADRFELRPDGLTLFRTGDRASRSEDGCLTFAGREDLQVKIRGHRVEPEAIEAAICRCPGILQCAVVAQERTPGEVTLAAFYCTEPTCKAGCKNVEAKIRAWLESELPSYMQPSVLCWMEELPRSPNGKIDRQALRERNVVREGETSQAAITTEDGPALDTPALEAMTALWVTVLKHSRFGADDSFFHVGGDSLSAFRLFLLIEEQFGLRVAPNLFREQNTLRQSARMLEEQANEQRLSPLEANRPQIVRLSAQGSQSPVVFVHPLSGSVEMYYGLVERMGLDRPCYGIHAPAYTADHSKLTIEGIASAYLESARALLQQNGKAVFAGYSLGGVIAYEMARQHAKNSGIALPVLIVDCESGIPRPRFQVAGDVIRTLPGWMRHVARKTNARALALRGVHRIRKILGLGVVSTDMGIRDAPAGRGTLHAHAKQFLLALQQYVARPYAGPVVLLRARHPGLFTMRDPSLGWSGLVPDLQVDTLPGWHAVCLTGENLAPSAEILRRHFDAFD